MAVLDRPFARFYDRVLEPSEVRGLANERRDLLARVEPVWKVAARGCHLTS